MQPQQLTENKHPLGRPWVRLSITAALQHSLDLSRKVKMGSALLKLYLKHGGLPRDVVASELLAYLRLSKAARNRNHWEQTAWKTCLFSYCAACCSVPSTSALTTRAFGRHVIKRVGTSDEQSLYFVQSALADWVLW